MSALAELAASEPGTALLREEGVFLDRRSFLRAISPPPRDALARLSQPSGRDDGHARPIVYMGQQLSVDYGSSVFAKLALLSELEAADDVRGCGLWVDVDRAGSDKRMTVISWPRRGGRVGVSMAPPGSKDCEPRFIPIEKRELLRALDRLRTYLGEAGVDRRGMDRYAHLRDVLSRSDADTLADLSAEVTDLLLAEYGIRLAPVRLSRLLEERDLTVQVEACLNALPRVIEVFNRAVFDLSERGIDPLLHPLADDYLPLRISCASDATRLPLRRRPSSAISATNRNRDHALSAARSGRPAGVSPGGCRVAPGRRSTRSCACGGSDAVARDGGRGGQPPGALGQDGAGRRRLGRSVAAGSGPDVSARDADQPHSDAEVSGGVQDRAEEALGKLGYGRRARRAITRLV